MDFLPIYLLYCLYLVELTDCQLVGLDVLQSSLIGRPAWRLTN